MKSLTNNIQGLGKIRDLVIRRLLFDFWYAWTDGEIADRMEVTTRTVYNLRQRAFKAIREFYEQGSSEP